MCNLERGKRDSTIVTTYDVAMPFEVSYLDLLQPGE
jgi:hypothetical protein